MNEEEKFDELLNSKLAERGFPFDELNWDEAERLIIQQEKGAKLTRFALIFSAGLAAGVVIMLPFLLNTHNALPTISTLSTANQNTVTQNNLVPPANQLPANINTTSKEEKAPLPVQSAFVKKDTRTGIRSQSTHISTSIQTLKEHSSVVVASINQPGNLNLIAAANKTNEHPEITSKGELNANENATKISPLPSTNPIATNSTQSNNTSSTNTQSGTSGNPLKNLTTNNDVPKNNAASTNTQVMGGNPMKNLTANNDAPKKTTDTATSNSPAILPPLNPDNPASSGPPATNILSVYAGGNYSFGWNNNGEKEGNGLTPWAGFNFTHYFSGDFSASVGIGYSELTGLNKTYTSSVIAYDFGANASSTTVTPQLVYYLAFPFKLQWNLDTKDMVGIGINYLLMLTTSSTLNTYKQSYSFENSAVSPTETPGTSAKQNGYTQGFNNSDIQLTASYTRMFGRFGISPELYYDFDNIENNTISGLNQNSKNWGFRMILSFQLMK